MLSRMLTRSAGRASRFRHLTLAAIFGLPLVVLGLSAALYSAAWPKRFAVVAEGQVFRSGAVSADQLRTLKERKGLRSVLCLLNPSARETADERAAAEAQGIAWINIGLPGDGASTPEQRERIKAAMREAPKPLLVHCAAGTNRTGLAIGMYRLHEEGWTLEQVMRELRAFGFKDEEHHENLRQALAEEARQAAEHRAASRPTTGAGS